MLAMQILAGAQSTLMAGDMPEGPPSGMPAKHISSNGLRCLADHSALTPASFATGDAADSLGQLIPRESFGSSPIQQLDSATFEPCRSTWALEEFAEVVRQCCEANSSLKNRKVRKELAVSISWPCVLKLHSSLLGYK